MKFSKVLASRTRAEWAEDYVRYKTLKKLLSGARDASTTRAFLQQLMGDLQRVNALVARERRECDAESVALIGAEEAQQGSVDPQAARAQAAARRVALGRRREALRAFCELNFTACYKASKKHDKFMAAGGGDAVPILRAVLRAAEAQPFMRLGGVVLVTPRRSGQEGGESAFHGSSEDTHSEASTEDEGEGGEAGSAWGRLGLGPARCEGDAELLSFWLPQGSPQLAPRSESLCSASLSSRSTALRPARDRAFPSEAFSPRFLHAIDEEGEGGEGGEGGAQREDASDEESGEEGAEEVRLSVSKGDVPLMEKGAEESERAPLARSAASSERADALAEAAAAAVLSSGPLLPPISLPRTPSRGAAAGGHSPEEAPHAQELAHFRCSLVSLHKITDAALQACSPELGGDEAADQERHRRMRRLHLALVEAYRSFHGVLGAEGAGGAAGGGEGEGSSTCTSSDSTPAPGPAAAAAAVVSRKAELFSIALNTLAEALALTAPDTAAALQIMVGGCRALFNGGGGREGGHAAQRSRRRAAPPPLEEEVDALNLYQAMRRGMGEEGETKSAQSSSPSRSSEAENGAEAARPGGKRAPRGAGGSSGGGGSSSSAGVGGLDASGSAAPTLPPAALAEPPPLQPQLTVFGDPRVFAIVRQQRAPEPPPLSPPQLEGAPLQVPTTPRSRRAAPRPGSLSRALPSRGTLEVLEIPVDTFFDTAPVAGHPITSLQGPSTGLGSEGQQPHPPSPPAPSPPPSTLHGACTVLFSTLSAAFLAALAPPTVDDWGSAPDAGRVFPTPLHRLWHLHRPHIFEWIGDYRPSKSLLGDCAAGVTIGVLLVPQGLVCATLAGLSPVYGLYAGLPPLLYVLFGTSRHAAIGPMSIPALMIFSGLQSAYADAPAPTPGEYARRVATVSFLTGATLLLMGWLRLSFLLRFVSRPVFNGFTAAAALLTMLSTAQDFLGARVARASVLQDYVVNIALALPSTHALSFCLSTGALLATLALARRIKVASLAIVLCAIAGTAAVMGGSGDGGAGGVSAAGVRIIGAIPSGLAALPELLLPLLTLNDIARCMPTAASVALVGFIESLAVAKLYAAAEGYEISVASELKAVGAACCMGSALLGTLPVMGAFGRSAINSSAGTRSQCSGAISAAVVLCILLAASPAIAYLPRPVLAAVLIAGVSSLLSAAEFQRLWASDRTDFAVMCAATAATLFLGVAWGVAAATALSLCVFLGFTTQPRVEEVGRLANSVVYKHVGMLGVARVPGLMILRFLSPLFFANASVLKDRVQRELLLRGMAPPRLRWRVMVLCLSAVAQVDSTSISVLGECAEACAAAGVPLVLSSANAYVEAPLRAAGMLTKLAGGDAARGEGFLYRRVHDAVRAALTGKVRLGRRVAARVEAPAAEYSVIVGGYKLF